MPDPDLDDIRKRLSAIARVCKEKRTEAADVFPDLPDHRCESIVAVLDQVHQDLEELFE